MKKLLASITLFALAGILFSSCSNTSKLSFNKRHYRSGYFVDRIGKSHTVVPIATVPIKPCHQITPIVTATSKNKVAINTLVASVKSHLLPKIATSQSALVKDDKPIYSASTGKDIFIANTNAYAVSNVTQSPVADNGRILSESNAGDGGSSERAALSLLWIVIVVILILWLIGILAGGWGLGGLINLLLVIALILLILWLLRIW